MKSILFTLFTAISFFVTAQNKLPIIKANSKSAKIYEEGNSVSYWGINPKIKLDIYTTNKLSRAKAVKFRTDTDSLTFKIKPGKYRDFIVVLNGKDSCLTRIQARPVKTIGKSQFAMHDSIPFFVNKHNTNLIPIVFNKMDSLLMNFDTGATEMSLTNDVLAKKMKSYPKLYEQLYEIELGKNRYESKIYDTQLVGDEAAGLIGWDLFDGMVVELNYDKNLMVVHQEMPKQVVHNPHFFKFKIRYINDRPFIESKIVQSGITIKNWFLFDTGYQSTVMLDNDLLKESKFPFEKMEIIKKVILHGTQNNEVPVITANLQELKIGPFSLTNVPAQVLENNKPMRGINIHILGNEVLKRFNTFLDFKKDVIYLMPNHSYSKEYIDQKKS